MVWNSVDTNSHGLMVRSNKNVEWNEGIIHSRNNHHFWSVEEVYRYWVIRYLQDDVKKMTIDTCLTLTDLFLLVCLYWLDQVILNSKIDFSPFSHFLYFNKLDDVVPILKTTFNKACLMNKVNTLLLPPFWTISASRKRHFLVFWIAMNKFSLLEMNWKANLKTVHADASTVGCKHSDASLCAKMKTTIQRRLTRTVRKSKQPIEIMKKALLILHKTLF